MRFLKATAAAAVLTFATAGLAACGGDSSTSEPTMSQSATAEMLGGDPSTWTPVVLDGANSGMFENVFVGQQGVVMEKRAVEIMSSDTSVVSVSQPAAGEFETWGGFSAVAPGTADVMAKDGNGSVVGTWTVNVAIKTMPGNPTESM